MSQITIVQGYLNILRGPNELSLNHNMKMIISLTLPLFAVNHLLLLPHFSPLSQTLSFLCEWFLHASLNYLNFQICVHIGHKQIGLWLGCLENWRKSWISKITLYSWTSANYVSNDEFDKNICNGTDTFPLVLILSV